jgi:hypothetical protein
MQKTALPLVACLLAFAATGVCAQTIYKWRDPSGVMHISDSPPPAGAGRDVVQSGMPGVGGVRSIPAPTPSAASGADNDLQRKKAQAEQAKAAASAADKARVEQHNAAARAQNCASAQTQSRLYSSGQRIATVNANGEREYLDDSAVAAKQKQSQQAISQYCGASTQP